MPIKSIKKSSVSDQIFTQLLEMIASEEWKSGDKILSENELAAMFGVSRNSVRTALQKLIALGMLESKQGEGTFVSSESVSNIYFNALMPALILGDVDLKEMLEFRRIIEVETVMLAAQRATSEEIKKMRDIVEEMQSEEYHQERFARQDMYFHELIAQSAKNAILNKVFFIVKEALVANQIMVQKIIGPQYAHAYHPMIISAIEEKNPELAAKLMKEHLDVTIHHAKQLTE